LPVKNVFFFAALLFAGLAYASISKAETFFATGHIGSLDKQQTSILIKSIQSQWSPESQVFILGDSNLDKPIFRKLWTDAFGSKAVLIPGNHEFDDGVSSYFEKFSFNSSPIETNRFIFFPMISVESLDSIVKDLLAWKEKFQTDHRIKVIMTHHRVWDDTVLSATPFKHDKAFFFNDLYQHIDGFIDFIIAGNSKRQHFQDLEESLGGKAPEIYTIFWMGIAGSVRVFNVGNGNAKPFAGFVKFTAGKGKRLVPLGYNVMTDSLYLTDKKILDIGKFETNVRDQSSWLGIITDKLKGLISIE